ncbi:MAG: cache domain-containing protein, partial [Stellaceae bacterium]
MRGLRLQLASLFLLAVLPGLVALAVHNYLQYRDTRAVEASRLWSRAELFAAPNGVLLNGVASMLRDLAKRPEIGNAARDPRACAQILANIDAVHPELDHLAVFTAGGRLVCADVDGLAADESTAPWFEHVLAKRQFAVGDYRPPGPENKGEIEAGYPVQRADGTPVAVIGTGIDIGWLTSRFAQLALEQGSVLTLFDRNGTALARYPDPEHLTGNRLALVAARIASGTERLDETEFLDGTTRVAAFAPLGGTEWHDLTVSVDIDPSELLASARWNLLLDLASLSSVVLIGAFAAFYWGGT